VGPKAGLDVLEKRHFASVCNRTQDCQACSFVTVLTTKSDPNMAVKASGQIPSTIKQLSSQNQIRQSQFLIAHCVILLVLTF
jgi:predicted XRE-type DNA-binding protein